MDLDRKGLFGTIAFHIVVLLLFIMFGFRTPLPLPGEAGIEVNFGDTDDGYGAEEPKFTEELTPQPPQEQIPEPAEETSEETVMTQDTEEAPAIAEKKKPKKKKEPKKEEPKKETPKPPKEEPKKKEPPKTNPAALYSGKKTNSTYTGPQGNTSGVGNQGSLTGTPDATNQGLGGGSGNQPGFYLHGRNPVSLKTPKIDASKQGKVVVQIKVNRDGKVTEANPGVKGSTTLDRELLAAAKKAALNSSFDTKPDAPFFQTGTITYIFSLK